MSGKSRKSNGFHQQRRIQSFGNQNEDIENQQRKTSFKNVFRGAQMVGLFPVSGLDKESSGIEFRPASLRLFATICFVLAVVILEGLGILHMLLFNEDNNPSSDFKHHSTISSNFAPVLHYGTTVACVILLLNMARRFPKTAELWEYAESQVESYNNDQGSKWSTVGLVLLIVSMALLQTTFGTLGTALVAESHRNDSSILDAFQHFLEEYRSGSHGFISSIMDDTFWSGLAIFIVSNYTVIMWIIVDLIIVLAPRNIAGMTKILNNALQKKDHDLKQIRQDHWAISGLTFNLNDSLSGILMAFYLSNFYFLWNHLMSLTWPPMNSTLYLMYQWWALTRQSIRLVLVTHYTNQVGKRLLAPLRKAMSLDNSIEAKKLQDQASLVYNGFTVGPFIPINEKTITLAISLFTFAYWMTLVVYGNEAMSIENPSAIIPATAGFETSGHKEMVKGPHNTVVFQRPNIRNSLNIIMW